MPDIDTIAAGLAADLTRQSSARHTETERLAIEAFRRGLQLGLSLRDWRALHSSPDHRSAQQEHDPCTRTH
jgi:hypothetical protein